MNTSIMNKDGQVRAVGWEEGKEETGKQRARRTSTYLTLCCPPFCSLLLFNHPSMPLPLFLSPSPQPAFLFAFTNPDHDTDVSKWMGMSGVVEPGISRVRERGLRVCVCV